jgi:hypothetical protein
MSFWGAVAHAARTRDPALLWSWPNLGPTAILLALAVLGWPTAFALAMWCRRPDMSDDYDDAPPRPPTG